ncbi:hypothetical protein CABS01_01997 [Colletotrichum abscissum]|nr:uncharacterized protein CABS01_01997 [Colletotrichum abscissum]KAK1488367.1 hypothetical protein CABS01_01997 [Colletotrichum abscissum]
MSTSVSINSLQAAAKRYGTEPLLVLPNGATVDLSKGYIPLLARYTFEDKAAQGLRKRKAGDKPENPIHFSALELVRDNSILLLTGPSGSGKTTVAKHLCHILASSRFSNARPLPRNDLGDIKEENWGASRLSPCYFSLSGTESLKRLADVTIPQLLGASGSQHEHLLIVLDDLQTAGDELISVLAKTLALIRERTYTKLLLLGDTDVLDRWSFPAVVRHELLPLLECQRREAVRSHLNLDPSTIITTGMGEAASNPAMFALAVQANYSGNCAEELLDAWLSSTHSQSDAASLLAERSYKLILHNSLTTGPTEMSLTAIQPNPALRSLTVQRLLAARHLADLTPQIAVGLFRDQPHASDDVLRSCLSRLSSLHRSGVLVDGLLGGTPADAKRAALLVAGLIPLSAEVERKVMKLLLEIVENGDCSAGEREKAGRLLSKYGDPRDLTELAEVPAGSFMMGSESHPNSQPLSRVSLERFRIGVYPVVNRDYAAFVKETSREWLSPGGKDPEKANAPATDLTWHDSRAYCQWLTERWREEKKISSNEHVRLPSEPEWECAAKGGRNETDTEGLAFPWGTDWQEHTANSDETGFNTTCAVGLFPRGLSPYGCHDMAGHVWECSRVRKHTWLVTELDRTCRPSSANMPIISDFKLPEDASALGRYYTTNSTAPFFITFTTSDHPDTGESWCPDVRAALPRIIAAFSPSSAPEMAFVEVGQRPEWRVPTNVFRTKWNVNNVPTIVRFELSDGELKETARLVEGEILDEKRLRGLIRNNQ